MVCPTIQLRNDASGQVGTEMRTALAIAVILCMFAFAADGLSAYLTGDDLMNTYSYWTRPTIQLIKEGVIFYPAEVFRPLGALYYCPLFKLFGLNPLPYRIVGMALLLANLGLLYLFCLRLSRSREVAALACLLGAYHAHLGDLYYNSGTIYDLLCFTCLYIALLYYMKIRDEGSYPGLWQTIALLALYIAALDAKEMAVALPVIVVIYELVFHPPKPSLRWPLREGRFVLLSIPVTIAYILNKVTGPNRIVTNESYRPVFTVDSFTLGWKHYLYDLFYTTVTFTGATIVMLAAAMLIVAWISRRRELVFACLAIVAGALPIIFIPPRGLYGIYLTLPAWYLFASVCLVILRDRLIPDTIPAPAQQIALFVAVALLLLPLHRHEKLITRMEPTKDPVRSVDRQLTAKYPSMPKEARILFLSDPFETYDYTLTFLFRLHYRDKEIQVDRVKVMGAEPNPEGRKSYHHIFRLTGGEVSEVDP